MRPSDGYRHLASLTSRSMLSPVVLTTNFDNMLERTFKVELAAGHLGSRTELVTLSPQDFHPIEPTSNQVLLLKMHGTLDDASDLMLTGDELEHLLPGLGEALSKWVTDSSLLIIGYGGRDTGITSAIRNAELRGKTVHWVGPDEDFVRSSPLARCIEEECGGSLRFVRATFDDFMADAARLSTSLVRRAEGNVLDELWNRLRKVRTSCAHRRETLSKMSKDIAHLPSFYPLNEVEALSEIVAYEQQKSGETYRLEAGVERLRRCVGEYRALLTARDTVVVELALLEELLNLFIVGTQLPEVREAYLDEVQQHGEFLYDQLPITRPVQRARCALILGEAYKERAMIVVMVQEQRRFLELARHWLRLAREAIANEEVPDLERLYLEGCADRHEAVIFEVEGDAEVESGRRRDKYDRWLALSQAAIERLRAAGDDASLSYALINEASAHTRVAEASYRFDRRRAEQSVARGLESLRDALGRFERLEDVRGQVWCLAHMCDALRLRCRVALGDISPYLLELENYANRSVGIARLTSDHLARGVALQQLGVALYLRHEAAPEMPPTKLARAKEALSMSGELLATTGFFRGAGQAYYWLARCFLLDPVVSDEGTDGLVHALRALTEALLVTGVPMHRTEELRAAVEKIEQEVERLI
jgi:hypothetical protein